MLGVRMSLTATVAVLSLVFVGPAAADTFTVNRFDDAPRNPSAPQGKCIALPNSSTDTCTLRAAVEASKQTAGTDTINLAAGTYTLGQAMPVSTADDDIGDLDIYPEGVTIVGQGTGKTTIDATNNDQADGIFQQHDGAALSVTGVSLVGGAKNCSDCSVATISSDGGPVALDGINLSGSGGTNVIDISNATGVNQALTLTNSTITNSTTTGPTINVAPSNTKGAITAGLTLKNTTISGNKTSNATQPVVAFHPSASTTVTGTIDITDTTITGNQSTAGSLTIAPGGTDQHVTANVATSTFQGNKVTGGSGGGLLWGARGAGNTLTLTDSTFSGNAADSGGGLAILGDGQVTVSGSTFDTNAAASGGAISIGDTAGSRLSPNVTITNSTIDGNTSQHQLGQDTSAGILVGQGTVLLDSDTISDNSVSEPGPVALLTAAGSTSGGIGNRGGSVSVRSTIVSHNGPSNCFGSTSSLGTNLDSGAGCGFSVAGDQQNADPDLGPLQDNHGHTKTRQPRSGSLVIDHGQTSGCPATDQRGVSRPQGSACDIGAFEVEPGSPPPGPGDPGPTVTIPPTSTVPLATTSTAKPTPLRKVAASEILAGLPNAKQCISRRVFKIHIRQPKGLRVREANVYLNAKKIATRKGKKVVGTVDLRGLPKGTFKVKIQLKLYDGRIVSGTRTYHTCAKKKLSKKGPKI